MQENLRFRVIESEKLWDNIVWDGLDGSSSLTSDLVYNLIKRLRIVTSAGSNLILILMRPRIHKSTVNVEFCYSTVVGQPKDNKLSEIKAELSQLNAKLAQLNKSNTPVAVEYKLFGIVVRKSLEIIPHLEAVGITFKYLYIWLHINIILDVASLPVWRPKTLDFYLH